MISNERIGELARMGYEVRDGSSDSDPVFYVYSPWVDTKKRDWFAFGYSPDSAWEHADAHARQQRDGADLAKRKAELERVGYVHCGDRLPWYELRDGDTLIWASSNKGQTEKSAELSAITAAEEHWKSVWPRAYRTPSGLIVLANDKDAYFSCFTGTWIKSDYPARLNNTERLPHADAVRLLAEAKGATEPESRPVHFCGVVHKAEGSMTAEEVERACEVAAELAPAFAAVNSHNAEATKAVEKKVTWTKHVFRGEAIVVYKFEGGQRTTGWTICHKNGTPCGKPREKEDIDITESEALALIAKWQKDAAPVQPDPWAGAVECVIPSNDDGIPLRIIDKNKSTLWLEHPTSGNCWTMVKAACVPCPPRPTVAPPAGMEIVAWRVPKVGDTYCNNAAGLPDLWVLAKADFNDDRHWIAAPVAKAEEPDKVKRIVERFLQWKLPKNFTPDCGISYKPIPDCEPVGTNLFDYEQAKQMVMFILANEMPEVESGKPVAKADHWQTIEELSKTTENTFGGKAFSALFAAVKELREAGR